MLSIRFRQHLPGGFTAEFSLDGPQSFTQCPSLRRFATGAARHPDPATVGTSPLQSDGPVAMSQFFLENRPVSSRQKPACFGPVRIAGS